MGLVEKLLTVTLEDWIYIIGSILFVVAVAGFVLVDNPHFDAQYRFVLRDGLDAFGDGREAGLSFYKQDLEDVNTIAGTSYGPDPKGDERLFCMKVRDGVVSELRFVDNVSESTRTSVSGGCTTTYSSSGFDGFLHTQPGYNGELSEEDRDLESPKYVDYTCIAYDELILLNGEVGGLNCWNVTGSGTDLEFKEIETGVAEKPDLIPPL